MKMYAIAFLDYRFARNFSRLCLIIVFICDLFVSRDDPLMS